MPPLKIPAKIGRYKVVGIAGRGGMGVVYIAEDPFIGRKVAIKTAVAPSPDDPAEFEKFQQFFFNEARAAGRLTHPNIVSVYDATVEGGHGYLVMEYIDGPTLKEYCRPDNLLPSEKAVQTVYQAATALEYAHQNGVIHRDIKPSNIMISRSGEVKISDFGIAAMEGVSGAADDVAAGSVRYSSPEQLRQEDLTPQTDIFSLGVVLYELLTGVNPFQADTDVATFFKITSQEPEPVRSLRQDVPESLERIVQRALHKNPSKRYHTARQLSFALNASFDHINFTDDELNFQEKFNILKKVAFFSTFTNSELTEVLKACEWVTHKADTVIITEGDTEDCFYILLSGKVMVSKNGKELATLKRGDCFGEMAYLAHTTRTATIETLTNAVLMRVKASLVERASIGTQLRFYKVFSQTLIHRLSRTSELLSRVFFVDHSSVS